MNYFKGLCKRLLFVVATVLNWVIYVLTLIPFWILEVCCIAAMYPVLWVLIGSKNLEIVCTKIFIHSNDELWYRDVNDDPDNFTSLWPLWGPYIQKHYLNKLIKDETNIKKK